MVLFSAKKLKDDVADYEELRDEVVEEEEEYKSKTMGSRQKAREHKQQLQRLEEKVRVLIRQAYL